MNKNPAGKKRKRSGKKKVKQLSAPIIKPTEKIEEEIVTPVEDKVEETVKGEEETGEVNGDAEQTEATTNENENENDEEGAPPTKKMKIPEELKDQLVWKNKQRVLIFCTRGITHKERLLMTDLRRMMPHSKKEGKFEGKNKLSTIPEICDMKNCNNCIFFESRKRKDLYMWLCKTPNGPGCRFLVTNIVPMSEHRLTGNCLKGSRPLLSFSAHFDEAPHLKMVKEMFTHAFGVPRGQKDSKPFIDHIVMFSFQHGRIFFRHYQILEDTYKGTLELVEIGPRFVMQLIRIFDGSFGGATLYKNPEFVNPNKIRSAQAKKRSGKYDQRVADKKKRKEKDTELHTNIPHDDRDTVFD